MLFIMIIYQIKNTVSNKIYVGSTNNFSSRKSQHFKELEKGKHHSYLLQRAYNKHGKIKFEMSIIYVLKRGENRVDKEQYYLDTLKPFYNVLKKVGTFNSPSPEGRERMRQSRIRPINQFDLRGNFIKRWDSIVEASKNLGIHEGSISWMCKGKYKQVGGFIFKYVDEEFTYDPAYKKISKEQRSLNHRKGASKTYLIEKENEKPFKIKNLLSFCESNDLNYNSLCSCISRFGKYKGMKITLVKGREKGN